MSLIQLAVAYVGQGQEFQSAIDAFCGGNVAARTSQLKILVMKRYVEASPRARQWFFLVAVLWAGFALLTYRFNLENAAEAGKLV